MSRFSLAWSRCRGLCAVPREGQLVDSEALSAPAGVAAFLGVSDRLDHHERKRLLAGRVIAALLDAEPRQVRVIREAPAQFGYHPRLLATVRGEEVPLSIHTCSRGPATVVAVADIVIPLGVDVRAAHPTPAELDEMRRHSHLFPDADAAQLLAHWTRVTAVRHADGRGSRVQPERVRLDEDLSRGWVPDRSVHYSLADLSRDSWTVTLAYGTGPR
ncbi:hypothetical protein SAMN05880568_1586 [Microbacterium sp. RURRCA19A]|nr:hypothetical protein SAMN05880568_1586 [Microbacterium sp. RURRCA19A]